MPKLPELLIIEDRDLAQISRVLINPRYVRVVMAWEQNIALAIKPLNFSAAILNLRDGITDEQFENTLRLTRIVIDKAPTLLIAQRLTNEQFREARNLKTGARQIQEIIYRDPHYNRDWAVVLNSRVRDLPPVNPRLYGFTSKVANLLTRER